MLSGGGSLAGLVGRCPAIESMRRDVRQFGASDVRVHVFGETGTGKERVARALHELSPRASRRFVPVNAAGIGDELLIAELFGHARGAFTGAVAAREGYVARGRGRHALPRRGRPSCRRSPRRACCASCRRASTAGSARALLRKADVRLVSATNVDLAERVRLGRFRQDLLVPAQDRAPRRAAAARARRRRAAAGAPLPGAAWRRARGVRPRRASTGAGRGRARRHAWPGNVRELESEMLRLVVRHPGRPRQRPRSSRPSSPRHRARAARCGMRCGGSSRRWCARPSRDTRASGARRRPSSASRARRSGPSAGASQAGAGAILRAPTRRARGRRVTQAGPTPGRRRGPARGGRAAGGCSRVVLLSFVSGLPLGLVWLAIPAWMARAGVDIRVIGLFTLAQAPWSFKLLWSPLMDRYTPPFLGRKRGLDPHRPGRALRARRSWLAGVSSRPDAVWVIGALTLAIAFASATQDIAIDAYAVEVLRRDEQGIASGARTALLSRRHARRGRRLDHARRVDARGPSSTCCWRCSTCRSCS